MSQHQQVVFVETSIQVQRVLAPRTQRVYLDRILTNSLILPVTSAYVWMEYQRAVVADYAHVHRVMGKHTNWGALFEHILDGERAFQPRSAVRCTKIIGQVYTESQQNYEHARQYLSIQIAYDLRQKFWANVTQLADPINCDLVKTGIVWQPDRTYTVAASCRKEEAAWPLGDLIIALQVPPGAALWTLDADFAPLATALAIPLYTPELATMQPTTS